MTITRHPIGLSPFVDIPDFRVFATTPNSRVQRKDASMTTDTKHILRMAMNIHAAAVRAERSADPAQARAELVVKFQQLCTDMGRICFDSDRPRWGDATIAAYALLCVATDADLARVGTWVHPGAISLLALSVSALGRVLGFQVADAATAFADAATATDDADDHARGAVEGGFAEAAE